MPRHALLLTCEHAGNRVPSAYRQLFAGSAAQRALRSHRGFDLGAVDFARTLAKQLRAPLISTDITRLLVDTNRSATHPRVCSEFTRSLDSIQRCALIAKYWEPHRHRVESQIERLTSRSPALHVAVHSFTPRLAGEVRNADIGLLYDPQYGREKSLADRWRALLVAAVPGLRVRRNYPYRGASDGLTTYLRRRLPASCYSGMELELNQRIFGANATQASDILRAVAATLRQLLYETE